MMGHNLKQTSALLRMSLGGLRGRNGPKLVTFVGTLCVVGVLISMLSMGAGVRQLALQGTRADRAFVMRSEAEGGGSLTREEVLAAEDGPGIKRGSDGKPLAAGVVLAFMEGRKKLDDARVGFPILGVQPRFFEVNPELHLTAGRMFQPALRELIVGKARYTEDQGLELGERVRLWGSDWTVVGHFESQSANEDAALLTDAETLLSAHQLNRFSRVQVVLDSPGALAVLDRALKANPTIHVEARSEAAVNREQSKSFIRLLDFVSYFVGAVMAAGATVGAVNAMYVLVDNRRRELATLRAIGFSSGPIVVAVLLESVLMSLPGALLGAGIAWILYNGHHVSPFGVSFDLTVNGSIVALGVAWAVAMGLLGGILPALRAARVPVTDALRAS
jgi:putative ABC transport system permease protein